MSKKIKSFISETSLFKPWDERTPGTGSYKELSSDIKKLLDQISIN